VKSTKQKEPRYQTFSIPDHFISFRSRRCSPQHFVFKLRHKTRRLCYDQ